MNNSGVRGGFTGPEINIYGGESPSNHRRLKIILVSSAFSLILLFLFLINISSISQAKDNRGNWADIFGSLGETLTVLFFNTKKSEGVEEVNNLLQIVPIRRAIWICLASMVGAIALVIGGSTIQSLTQNPLADTTTLGFISSTIFGIIFMKGMVANILEVSNYHLLYFLFALLGGLISLFILGLLFRKPYNRTHNLKIILIGLVLNMIFKTFTHLIKTYNSNAVNTSFALAMGGAENIYSLYSNQFNFLKWCSIGVFILLSVCILFSQKLNLFELGEEQAKTLGVNIVLFKNLGYLITLLSSTVAITLVGNITFLGLICTHSVRSMLGTRKYQVIIPVASLMACMVIMFGVPPNSLCPYISSSMFILLLGGAMLLNLTLKNREM